MDQATSPSPTPRFEWGPTIGDYQCDEVPAAAADASASPARQDVELAFIPPDDAAKKAGEIHFDVPAHDPATHVQPERVYVILYAPGVAVHSTPESAVQSGQTQNHTDVPPSPAGATVVVSRPDGVKAGVKYTTKTVLQFPGRAAACGTLRPVPNQEVST